MSGGEHEAPSALDLTRPMIESKDGDKPVTAEFCASLGFEPWVDCQKPPTNDEWIAAINPHLVIARIAWVTCQKTNLS